MTYPNYTQEQMTAQYAKVNALVAQIETLVGEDPYREMTDAEVAKLVELTAARSESWNEMRYMETAIRDNLPHDEGQADF